MTHDNVTDIVERLRKVEGTKPDTIGISTCWHRNPDGPEAASTIATLRKQLENAREALREYLDAEEIDDPAIRLEELAVCRTKAREALKGQPC